MSEIHEQPNQFDVSITNATETQRWGTEFKGAVGKPLSRYLVLMASRAYYINPLTSARAVRQLVSTSVANGNEDARRFTRRRTLKAVVFNLKYAQEFNGQ